MRNGIRCAALAITAVAILAPVGDAIAQTEGHFSTLTYNVAGLLEPFSGSDPSTNTPIISCLVRAYDVVQVQEDFNYHAALYDSCDDHPYRSPTSGGMGFGSGLNTLSRLPYMDWTRESWDACVGIDCLTPKGFTLARIRLGDGAQVDVYNLHAQAQVDTDSLAARRDNIVQLARYIEWQSAGNAVIVMGDTNTRYTRSGDNIRELLARGFRDVWVDRLRGGAVPAAGAPALTACEPAATSAHCEVVDKVLYRSGPTLSLTPTDYRVEDQRFVDGAGRDLSDHLPIAVGWRWQVGADRRTSDVMGGPHGDAFNDAAILPASPALTRLSLRAGERVDQVGFTLANGHVVSHGGGGGAASGLDLASDERVQSAVLCQGERSGRTRVFYAAFTTSRGRTLAGGSRTGSCATFHAPAGWQVVGFHGRAGAEVDKLGLVFAPIAGGAPAAAYTALVNRSSGLCLDIWEARLEPGSRVAQWHCSGADWQRWHHDPHSGLIRSRAHSGLCLDNGGHFGDGADMMVWTCTGSANQRFDVDASAGVVRVRTNPAQVLDGVGAAPGDDVVTWTDWGGANQRWSLQP
jgi:endonuclease/exonuclease/phosphatase family metal-dependent hydrolase